eukprot:scaffold42265_cov64-Phaeocystis_antarctica.AAC.4
MRTAVYRETTRADCPRSEWWTDGDPRDGPRLMVVRPVKAVDFTAFANLGARLEPPSRDDALTAARGGVTQPHAQAAAQAAAHAAERGGRRGGRGVQPVEIFYRKCSGFAPHAGTARRAPSR